MSRIIPTYENGVWSKTEFATDEEFISFLNSVFKEPGKYNFDETSLLFNEQARRFNKDGIYCRHPFRSKDFTEFWDD